jgi:hypothetical protein
MEKLEKGWANFKELGFCQLCLAIVFISSGLVINGIQALLYITIRPFDPMLYRRINYYVTYMLNSREYLFYYSLFGGFLMNGFFKNDCRNSFSGGMVVRLKGRAVWGPCNN